MDEKLKRLLTEEAITRIARKLVNEIALKLTLPRSEDQIFLRTAQLKIYTSLQFHWMRLEDEMLMQMRRENKALKAIAAVIH
jgi:hypothetical protein